MAIVKSLFQIKGSVGEYTFYTMRGSKKLIMRTKGGPNKKQMENSPNFENVRKNQTEFGGCTKFGSKCRKAFGELYRFADYNLNSVLTGIGKTLMKMDTTNEPGKRSLNLSTHKEMLEGFNFNKGHSYTSVLRVFPAWELKRDALQAVVTYPVINTGIDLQNFKRLPFFRLIIAVGTVSDMTYDTVNEKYKPMVEALHGASDTLVGEWNSTQTILPAQSMTVQMHESRIALLTDNVTVLLSMGIEFGNVGVYGEPVEANNIGSGKVIACR